MNTPSPDTPPMPWPFSYPPKFPKPWVALNDGERKNFPLIGGSLGRAWIQAGYTISKGNSIGGDHDLFGAKKDGKSAYLKMLFVKLGVTQHADGMSYWESISLPKFLSQAPTEIRGNARPVLTFSLKPQGPLGWDSVLTIRYEDVYWVEIPDTGKVQASSGVFLDLSIQRILVTSGAIAMAAYGLYHLIVLGSAPNPNLPPEGVPAH